MSEHTSTHNENASTVTDASNGSSQRCGGNGRCDHRLHMCGLIKKERLRSWIVELIREPSYYCRSCGRVAREPGYLCRPSLL